MSERTDFALEPGVRPGDSAFLLNSGRHRLAFDAYPGRMILIAFLGPVLEPFPFRLNRNGAPSPCLERDLARKPASTSRDHALGAAAEAALAALEASRRLVDEGGAVVFAVASGGREIGLEARFPSVRFLWDGAEMARAFGLGQGYVVLDPMLRVTGVAPLGEAGRALSLLGAAPPPSPPCPVLLLADVFEPELCRHLIACFERGGGRESGFMQDEGGRGVENFDTAWKRRRDVHLTDAPLVAALRARIGRRICPEIRKAFQMRLTRIERDLVARYDCETGGHFGPHRDDTGVSVAHRRFAVSINLNADFDGGEISFPEYSPRGFKAAPGTAIVFSASILHQVSRVTRGRRYVFLTFLFDEEAERMRQANLRAMREGGVKPPRECAEPCPAPAQ